MSRRFLVSGPFKLDLIDERLLRDGEAVPLGSKPFALLRTFMEAPQTLLTKDALVDQVWAGMAVSDAVLTTAIKDLRRALGDDARNPTIIRTAHGKGYRYMLPVEAADAIAGAESPPPAPRPSRRWLIGGVGGVGITAAAVAVVLTRPSDDIQSPKIAEKSLAVLPFRDLSAAQDQDWFADGLTEEVLTSLSRAPDLQVVSQSATARFRNTRKSPGKIARELSVAHILEGAVRKAGDRVRVNVNLINGADEAHIWSKSYDAVGADVLSVQEDIAFDIARALHTVMDPVKLRAMVSSGTRSVEAYEAYLRGLALNQREQAVGDIDLARRASAAFDRARELDPAFAAAHWQAAQHWFGDAVTINPPDRHGLSEAELLRRYLERVDKAIATSTNDLDTLKYRAAAATARVQLHNARSLLERYVKARPDDLDGWEALATVTAYAGDGPARIEAARRFDALSRRDRVSEGWSIGASILTQDYPTAARRAEAHLAADPGNPYLQFQTHRALIANGQAVAARPLLTQVESSDLPQASRLLASLRQACAEGRQADAASLRRSIDDTGQRVARWNAAQLMNDQAGSVALLRPLDTPDKVHLLMQYLLFPNFDARPFPTLSALLTREGIVRPPPAPVPAACRAS